MRSSCILLSMGLALDLTFVNSFLIAPAKNGGRNVVLGVANSESTVDRDKASDAATLRSMTFSDLLQEQEPQLLCNFLMELGACSTSIIDADVGTDTERALFHEFDAGRITQTAMSTQVWDHCHVSAHFPASTNFQWIMEIVKESFPELPDYKMTQVENKDWVLHVQQSWKPIVVDSFVLRFPWHTDEMVQEALAGKKALELKLQGGIAFGTGEHPTTQMCLEWIAKVCSKKGDIKIMDYGAGSGVLGMAACKLDPTIEAIGVDIDVDAVHIANANSEINHVNMVNYLSDLVDTSDSESKSVLMKAYSIKQGDIAKVLPDEWNGPIYDACVANILAGPLVTLAPTLAGLVRPGGYLGLSGIMSSQSNMVLEAYATAFDDVKVERELGGWVLITGRRRDA
jgi:ribosomal protein L11 methyltransferase